LKEDLRKGLQAPCPCQKSLEVELPVDLSIEGHPRLLQVELPVDLSIEGRPRLLQVELPVDLSIEGHPRLLQVELPVDLSIEGGLRSLQVKPPVDLLIVGGLRLLQEEQPERTQERSPLGTGRQARAKPQVPELSKCSKAVVLGDLAKTSGARILDP